MNEGRGGENKNYGRECAIELATTQYYQSLYTVGRTSRNYNLLSSHLANGRTFIAWSINEGTFWSFETWWEAEYFLSFGTNGPMIRAEHYIL